MLTGRSPSAPHRQNQRQSGRNPFTKLGHARGHYIRSNFGVRKRSIIKQIKKFGAFVRSLCGLKALILREKAVTRLGK
jgi:hypothetical protein